MVVKKPTINRQVGQWPQESSPRQWMKALGLSGWVQRPAWGWSLPVSKLEGIATGLGPLEKSQEAEFSPTCNLTEHLFRGTHHQH